MTEDAMLFAAALAEPAEDTPRLVLADWLDEHDEPELALVLRAEPRLIALLAGLTRWDTVPHWNAPLDRLAQRDAETRRFSLAGVPASGAIRFAVPNAA